MRAQCPTKRFQLHARLMTPMCVYHYAIQTISFELCKRTLGIRHGNIRPRGHRMIYALCECVLSDVGADTHSYRVKVSSQSKR